MSRSISIVRRRSNLVDLTIRQRPNITGFRFSAIANFGDTLVGANFQVVSNAGYVSKTVINTGSIGSQFRDQVRFLFNPADYTAIVSAVVDNAPFFLSVESQNPDGSFNAAEALHLVLPPYPGPNLPFPLTGTATNAASLASSIEIQLPMLCNDFMIRNNGGDDLAIAFSRPGFEVIVPSLGTLDHNLSAVSQVFMRGDGADVDTTMLFTLRNNEII